MSKWITTDYFCMGCECRFHSLEERSEVRPNLPCPRCAGSAMKAIGAPRVMKKAYLDGQRKGDGTWQKMKEASDLEIESLDLRPEKRVEYQKEIHKLTKTED